MCPVYIVKKKHETKLTNDIDLSGINWTPIDKNIVGIFNGDGHKISNLTIEIPDLSPIAKVGLFAEFTGIIENVTLENPNIHMVTISPEVVDSTDYYGVGGFVGLMKEGYIYNCKTTLTEGSTASITASIDNIGGFIGHTSPNGLVTIINSENKICDFDFEAKILDLTLPFSENGRSFSIFHALYAGAPIHVKKKFGLPMNSSFRYQL